MLVTMVFTPSRRNFITWATFNWSSANALNLDQSKILLFGKDG